MIGIANGTLREVAYKDRVGELTAHQISTGSAIALFAGYFELLARRRPLTSAREALEVGVIWLALTVAFEFGFGRASRTCHGASCSPTMTCARGVCGRSSSPGSCSDRPCSGLAAATRETRNAAVKVPSGHDRHRTHRPRNHSPRPVPRRRACREHLAFPITASAAAVPDLSAADGPPRGCMLALRCAGPPRTVHAWTGAYAVHMRRSRHSGAFSAFVSRRRANRFDRGRSQPARVSHWHGAVDAAPSRAEDYARRQQERAEANRRASCSPVSSRRRSPPAMQAIAGSVTALTSLAPSLH